MSGSKWQATAAEIRLEAEALAGEAATNRHIARNVVLAAVRRFLPTKDAGYDHKALERSLVVGIQQEAEEAIRFYRHALGPNDGVVRLLEELHDTAAAA